MILEKNETEKASQSVNVDTCVKNGVLLINKSTSDIFTPKLYHSVLGLKISVYNKLYSFNLDTKENKLPGC